MSKLSRLRREPERLERHHLAEGETDRQAGGQRQRARRQERPLVSRDSTAQESDHGSAHGEAQHGNADDHVREMVPLGDGERSHERDLVGDPQGADQQDGGVEATDGCASHSALVKGTNRTGIRLRCTTRPLACLSISMSV